MWLLVASGNHFSRAKVFQSSSGIHRLMNETFRVPFNLSSSFCVSGRQYTEYTKSLLPRAHCHFLAALRTRTNLRARLPLQHSSVWITKTKNHDRPYNKWCFLLFCFLRRASGDKNVHYSNNNGTSEAAQKGEWLWIRNEASKRRKQHHFSNGKHSLMQTFLLLLPWKAFANPEDALRHGGLQYHRQDPYVERCRR